MNKVFMDQVDDRTFRANFSADGLVKLKDMIDIKLQEFMGDYADDSLVEYVIVLISNGRHKEEAKSELDVFLGDDCDSFVSWLWDHLTSNINQYVESQKPIPDETLMPNATSPELDGSNNPCHLDTDKDQAEYDKEYKKRHKRKWRARMSNESQQPTLHSCVVGKVESERNASQSGRHSKQSASTNPPAPRKRSRGNEHERPKLMIGATRRLLQFAVRDALATARPSTSVKETGVKRLCSVVSTPNGGPTQKVQDHRIQSTPRVPDTIAAAVNAVAEAAEDVGKTRFTRTVSDQLNRGAGVPESTEEVALFRDNVSPDIDGDYYDHLMDYYHRWEMSRQMKVEQGDYSGKYIGKSTMLQSYNELAFDTASDNKGYDGINVINDRLRSVPQTGSFSKRNRDNSHKVQYSMAQKAGQVSHRAQVKEHDPSVSATSASRKILNISVNVNTWKPPHYQPTIDATELNTGRSSAVFMKENKNSFTPIGNGKATAQRLNETQKNTTSDPGIYSTGHPLEFADNRTIFVNNVHFAATKDTLSRHFNKFGEVLKVTILTDAATGQPKGSAYVEFMLKDAAENAISLDGTSFMSRILKVVKKSSGLPEATASMTRPRVSKNTPFVTARFSQAHFPGANRARPPSKRGNSMQWKRDTKPCQLQNVSHVVGNRGNASIVAGRGLTYIRGETNSTDKPGPL